MHPYAVSAHRDGLEQDPLRSRVGKEGLAGEGVCFLRLTSTEHASHGQHDTINRADGPQRKEQNT